MVNLIISRTPGPNLLLPQADAGIIFATALAAVLSGAYFGHLIFRMFGQLFPTRRWIQYLWVVVFGLMLLTSACSALWVCVNVLRIHRYWIPQLAAVNIRGTPINMCKPPRASRLSACGSYEPVDILWLSSAAAVDVTLAVILVARFLKDIRRDGFAQTNSILIRLVISTLEYGLTVRLAVIWRVDLRFEQNLFADCFAGHCQRCNGELLRPGPLQGETPSSFPAAKWCV